MCDSGCLWGISLFVRTALCRSFGRIGFARIFDGDLYRILEAGFGQRVSMGDCRTIGNGKCLDRLESAIEKQYVCSSIVTFAWVWGWALGLRPMGIDCLVVNQ